MTYSSMTRQEFKEKWASGQPVYWDDIANCAKEWGIVEKPHCCPMMDVRYLVLLAAGVPNAEEYNPDYLEYLEAQE